MIKPTTLDTKFVRNEVCFLRVSVKFSRLQKIISQELYDRDILQNVNEVKFSMFKNYFSRIIRPPLLYLPVLNNEEY